MFHCLVRPATEFGRRPRPRRRRFFFECFSDKTNFHGPQVDVQ